jgi:hypothetical protein
MTTDRDLPVTHTIGIAGVTVNDNQQSDTQQIGASFQYSFGKAAHVRTRNNTTGATDEQERAK